jgi:hypothetical protein
MFLKYEQFLNLKLFVFEKRKQNRKGKESKNKDKK